MQFEQVNPIERHNYYKLLSALPLPLLILAGDLSIVLINRAFRRVFDLNDPSDPKVISQLFPSERLIDRIRGAQLRWDVEELEHRIKTSSGLEVTEEFTEITFKHGLNGKLFRLTLVPICGLDDDDKLNTLVLFENSDSSAAFGQELTAESQITSMDSATARISSAVPIGLWQADAATLGFDYVSLGAEFLLGYPAAYWTETPNFFIERIHPEDRASVLAVYSSAIERNADATAEFRAVTASGSLLWCRETIRTSAAGKVPLPLEEAALKPRKNVIGVLSDISRHKQLVEQLIRSERTHARQLVAKSVAHDLNNPLMVIAGYAEEIRHALPKDHSAQSEVDQILAAAQRISRLSEQLRELAVGKAKAPQLVDVVKVIAGIEQRITTTVGESVTVDLQLNGPEWAMADPHQLEEVVLAITSDGTQEKSVHSRLMITCTSEILSEHIRQAPLRPDVYTCVTIRREGTPLSEFARSLIFESPVVKESGDEGGQTLAQAYHLVRNWGGDIALTSDQLGSTFMIYLRRRMPESRDAGMLEDVEEASSNVDVLRAPVTGATSQTILIVDDESHIRSLIVKVLRRDRYLVLEAASAEEALRVASRHLGRIDLLVTDVILPGLSGRQLAELMFSERSNLKVIYISGYTDDEGVRRGSSPPGARYLQKPFTFGAFIGLVQTVLES